MSAQALEEKLIDAKKSGCLPKVVVPVDLCGQSCDMQAIAALGKEYGFRIIEDASHGVGGKYQGQFIGGGQYADMTIFSFHPVKIITTAEGGLALTNDPGLAQKMGLLRSHGITRDPALMTSESHGPWYYQQIDLGYNYRMTEIQAALGLTQMGRLDDYVRRRADLAAQYDQLLADLPVITPWQHPDTCSAWHLYVVRLHQDQAKHLHHEVFTQLRAAGVGVNLHYIPIHTQPYYQKLGFKHGDFPVAEAYYDNAISLPLYPSLSDNDQQHVVKSLQAALGR